MSRKSLRSAVVIPSIKLYNIKEKLVQIPDSRVAKWLPDDIFYQFHLTLCLSRVSHMTHTGRLSDNIKQRLDRQKVNMPILRVFAGLYYFFFVYETVIFRLLTLYLSSLCLMLSLRRPVCVICDARDRQRVKGA